VTPTVDVAVVAYRHWDLTRSCLEHLARQTTPHRVTLCDNGCDEGTAERAAAEFPDVAVVRLERNMPYAVACNRAVANGSAELVLMMNNDVDIRPDFVERVVAAFAADPALGSLGTLLLRPGEERIDSAGMVVDPTLSGFTRLQGLPSAQAGAARPGVTGPYGAAAAFRRAAWVQVGGLDETIPSYCEDLDLALRLRQAGWPTALALDAVGVHIGGATFGYRSSDQRRRAGYGRGYILRRYRVLRGRAALRALITEAIVVAGDLLLSRDLAALRGRVAGWRGAASLPARTPPPAAVLDQELGFMESLRLRRGAYER
jgi:N-acetylglucosaminyl-diphospho-decaprenol L-rhamnosyltransferase